MFKPTGMNAPTIDTSMFSGAGFSGNISITVERARDDALDAAESATASAVSKRDAWCKLATLDGVNPYKDEAAKLCSGWGKYVDDESKLEQSLTADFDVLVDYLDLRRRTVDEKKSAVASFLDVYGKYDQRQEILAAKLARDNLANGAPAGITKDNDRDGILVDSCPDQGEDKDGDHDDDGCPDASAGDLIGGAANAVDNAGFRLHALNFGYFRVDAGASLGFGLWDQQNVPKFDQISLRPLVGANLRLTWAFLETGIQGDWDLSRDFEDGGTHLTGLVGARLFGIGPWTPSAGLDYRNLFNLAAREGGPGVYFANTFNVLDSVSARLTYRYGLDPPGHIIPVHTVFLEMAISLADPKGSAFFDLLEEMDLCG
jgi:hypothetical protein